MISMDKRITLSLIENSFDFLEATIENAKKSDKRSWKYALLNLASALELLMKAVLEQEHWSLLFIDTNKANKEDLHSGNLKSINFETCIQRLQNVAGVALSVNDLKYIEKIRQIRNRITHFSVDLHVEEVQSIIAKCIGIFTKLNREIDTDESVEDRIHYINSELADFERYVKLHLAEIEKDISKLDRPSIFLSCPLCLQETIVINAKYDELLCKFCGGRFSYQDMAECASDGYGGPCPECSNGALAHLLFNSEYICVKCGFISEENYNFQCISCQNVYWDINGDDEYLCDSCHKSMYD